MPKAPKRKTRRKARKRRIAMYRDARTGEAVSKQYAEQNPDTTVRETR